MGSVVLSLQRVEPQAAGAKKKPSDSQMAKAVWATQAARDRDEEFFRSSSQRRDISGRTKTPSGIVRRTSQRSGVIDEGAGMLGDSLLGLAFGFSGYRCQRWSSQWLSGPAGSKILQTMWEGPFSVGVWNSLDPWDVVGLRPTASVWNIPRKYGPFGELLFFLIKKELFALTKALEPRLRVTAETLKACALRDRQ